MICFWNNDDVDVQEEEWWRVWDTNTLCIHSFFISQNVFKTSFIRKYVFLLIIKTKKWKFRERERRGDKHFIFMMKVKIFLLVFALLHCYRNNSFHNVSFTSIFNHWGRTTRGKRTAKGKLIDNYLMI